MDNYRIACFDVYYYDNYAKACGIVFELYPIEVIISQYCKEVKPVKKVDQLTRLEIKK